VEELVRLAKRKTGSGEKTPKKEEKTPAIRDLEARLARRLGTRVEVRDESGAGQLVIHYGSLDELDRLLAQLGV
jgi:ParB family chromosome partitioning protein